MRSTDKSKNFGKLSFVSQSNSLFRNAKNR